MESAVVLAVGGKERRCLLREKGILRNHSSSSYRFSEQNKQNTVRIPIPLIKGDSANKRDSSREPRLLEILPPERRWNTARLRSKEFNHCSISFH